MFDVLMECKYFGNVGEWFVIGGGMQSFENFEKWEGIQNFMVCEGLKYFVNFVFVWIMCDILCYFQYQLFNVGVEVLINLDFLQWQVYL